MSQSPLKTCVWFSSVGDTNYMHCCPEQTIQDTLLAILIVTLAKPNRSTAFAVSDCRKECDECSSRPWIKGGDRRVILLMTCVQVADLKENPKYI